MLRGVSAPAFTPTACNHPQPTLNRHGTKPQVDLFGEISGVSFTPAADALFIGISDVTYSSLLQVWHGALGSLSMSLLMSLFRSSASQGHGTHQLSWHM